MFTIRLWHYKLLPVLPDEFIIAEWRECIAIKRQWEKGTLKHRLVSYVMNYNRDYFMSYVNKVCSEMMKRNIKYQQKYYDEIFSWCKYWGTLNPDFLHRHYPEHTYNYLRQCYFNLEEKYDRGIINKDEWHKIHNLYWEVIIDE